MNSKTEFTVTLYARFEQARDLTLEACAEVGEHTATGVNAADWLDCEPAPRDAVVCGLFDTNDKMGIFAPPKSRKTFFAIAMALKLAAGSEEFLGWRIPKKRRVLVVQFEVKPDEFHCRLLDTAKALGLTRGDIGRRLRFENLRGEYLADPVKAAKRLIALAVNHQAEVVIIDPLYSLIDGDENSAEDVKPILFAFDAIMRQTGAAVVFVHHYAKGRSGDKSTRDRAAGSGVISRAYDSAIFLNEQLNMKDGLNVETDLRNYPCRDPFVIRWEAGRHVIAAGVVPQVVTSQNGKKSGHPLQPDDDAALAFLTADGPKSAMALDHSARNLLQFSKDGAKLLRERLIAAKKLVVFREPVPNGVKWHGTPDQIQAKRREFENPPLPESENG